MAVTGSITVTKTYLTNTQPTSLGRIQKVACAWTSDASGGTVGSVPIAVEGSALVQATFVPGTSSTQPTDQYDVTVLDGDGLDILNGAGANLSNSTPKVSQFALPGVLTVGQLFPSVSNAGNSKTGTINLFFRMP